VFFCLAHIILISFEKLARHDPLYKQDIMYVIEALDPILANESLLQQLEKNNGFPTISNRLILIKVWSNSLDQKDKNYLQDSYRWRKCF